MNKEIKQEIEFKIKGNISEATFHNIKIEMARYKIDILNFITLKEEGKVKINGFTSVLYSRKKIFQRIKTGLASEKIKFFHFSDLKEEQEIYSTN